MLTAAILLLRKAVLMTAHFCRNAYGRGRRVPFTTT